jgi:hypothetical protein
LRNKIKKKNVSEVMKSSSKAEKTVMLNFNDVTEIIKQHHKEDQQMDPFKAVCNYNDKDFTTYLGWLEPE